MIMTKKKTKLSASDIDSSNEWDGDDGGLMLPEPCCLRDINIGPRSTPQSGQCAGLTKV
jgi:hypothetical protein